MTSKRFGAPRKFLAVSSLGIASFLAPAIASAAATQISTGGIHSCALTSTGSAVCWGYGGFDGEGAGLGELGYGNLENIGDDEFPFLAGTVPVGAAVTQISAGYGHTCALIAGGNVRCWGEASSGQLGYANTTIIGDNEPASAGGNVNIGGTVTQIASGELFTCARLSGGNVRCFGINDFGQLGYGNDRDIGDDETPASAGDVPLGGSASQVAVGAAHACALLSLGRVRCWGSGFFGQLGYADDSDIGDDETPASKGDVAVGGTVVQLAAGDEHTCALLNNGHVRCWGDNGFGQLGYGNPQPIGDDEAPSTAGDVNVGGNAVQITAGAFHTCALLTTGRVRCWGDYSLGKLGYPGLTDDIGNNEAPASAGDINLGGIAVQVAAGLDHTCARLDSGLVRCWGDNFYGQLGYPNVDLVGDDETPASAGDVRIEGLGVPLPRGAGFGYAAALAALGVLVLRRPAKRSR